MKALGFDRLEAMTEHGLVGRIQQRLHFCPLCEVGLPHLTAQAGERTKLSVQRQLVLAVHIVQETGLARFAQRLGELLWPDVPRFDAVVLEQFVLRERFQCANQGDHGCFNMPIPTGSPTRMREQVQVLHLLDLLRIEHEFLQEARVLLDAGQQALDPRRASPHRRHVQRLQGRLQLLPARTIVKPFPQRVPLGKIGERPVERFLPSADTRFNVTERCRGRIEGSSIEEVARVTACQRRRLIPGIPLEPDALGLADGNRLSRPGRAPLGPAQHDHARGGRDPSQDHGRRHRRRGLGQIEDQLSRLNLPGPQHVRQHPGDRLIRIHESHRIRSHDPIPSSGHLRHLGLHGTLNQALRRFVQEKTQHVRL